MNGFTAEPVSAKKKMFRREKTVLKFESLKKKLTGHSRVYRALKICKKNLEKVNIVREIAHETSPSVITI